MGTLIKHTNVNPHGKLKIEIFGGQVENRHIGEETYTISARGGLKINREVRCGSVGNYSFHVFETDTEYHFAVKPILAYVTIWIKSWILNPSFNGQFTAMNPITIKEYDPTGKGDVTAQFLPNTIIATTYSGNVGIGTDAPLAKLDVKGKIIADEVEIKVNKGADFVFESDYNLKSLSEVEDFINVNKHLPEIPSEKEMQEKGLNVNEMQIKLLQKIEELTLYVIDLKKENEEQSKRIEKQDKIIQELQLKK